MKRCLRNRDARQLPAAARRMSRTVCGYKSLNADFCRQAAGYANQGRFQRSGIPDSHAVFQFVFVSRSVEVRTRPRLELSEGSSLPWRQPCLMMRNDPADSGAAYVHHQYGMNQVVSGPDSQDWRLHNNE